MNRKVFGVLVFAGLKTIAGNHNFAPADPILWSCDANINTFFLLKQLIGQWYIRKLLKIPFDCICIYRNLA